MGMFDYVKYSAPCEKCGESIDEFQSKDSKCHMDILEPYQVANFYALCPKCGAWNEFDVETEVQVIKCEITRA